MKPFVFFLAGFLSGCGQVAFVKPAAPRSVQPVPSQAVVPPPVVEPEKVREQFIWGRTSGNLNLVITISPTARAKEEIIGPLRAQSHYLSQLLAENSIYLNELRLSLGLSSTDGTLHEKVWRLPIPANDLEGQIEGYLASLDSVDKQMDNNQSFIEAPLYELEKRALRASVPPPPVPRRFAPPFWIEFLHFRNSDLLQAFENEKEVEYRRKNFQSEAASYLIPQSRYHFSVVGFQKLDSECLGSDPKNRTHLLEQIFRLVPEYTNSAFELCEFSRQQLGDWYRDLLVRTQTLVLRRAPVSNSKVSVVLAGKKLSESNHRINEPLNELELLNVNPRERDSDRGNV